MYYPIESEKENPSTYLLYAAVIIIITQYCSKILWGIDRFQTSNINETLPQLYLTPV